MDVLGHLAARLQHAGRGIIALSGPQGAGKSTITAQAADVLGDGLLVLSLDDFYLPRAARSELASRVSPLFETRGPPGTHDVALLGESLAALTATPFRPLKLPRFDKRIDDRCPPEAWQAITAPPDAVIVEGWCMGATLAPGFSAGPPINAIELRDANMAWRAYQAAQLAGPYAALWDQMGDFIHLEAPSFETVLAWRTQQEASNLAMSFSDLPSERREWVGHFVQHYERLTRDMAGGNRRPGLVLQLNDARQIISVLAAV